MISLQNVTKEYDTRQGKVTVFRDINLTIERGQKLGVLGANGAGKSTLIRLVSGVERPTRGQVHRGMRVSWPLAFTGAFQGSLTGLDNLRFICRVYGTSVEDKIEAVQDFSELGRYLREPVKTYSAGMRARLGFAISMVIEFDCFLIDEVVAVGDERFAKKCEDELFAKRHARTYIFASHNLQYIRQHCEQAAVLANSQLTYFGDVSEAIAFHQEAMSGAAVRSYG
jgi:capsular polysaccharide transport system ATP-binding protein